MTKKLKIIGPYTPEHPGPFCTRGGQAVRLLCTDRKGRPPIIGLVQDGGMELLLAAGPDGVAVTMSKNYDLMNAEEAPVAREFWIVQYSSGTRCIFTSLGAAIAEKTPGADIIHVREVLQGDGE